MKDMDTVGALPGLGSIEIVPQRAVLLRKSPAPACAVWMFCRVLAILRPLHFFANWKSNIIRRSGTHSEVRMDTPCPAGELNWSCPGFITMSAE